MPSSHKYRALFMVFLSVAGMVYTLVAGNKPFLGLDLQGGVSVVLEPVGDADAQTLDQTRDIIKQRVDGLGVAEPDVKVQGSNIVVSLPGVEDQQRVLQLVGETAELRFRPVYLNLGGGTAADDAPANEPEPMPVDPESARRRWSTTQPTRPLSPMQQPTRLRPTQQTDTTAATGDEQGLTAITRKVRRRPRPLTPRPIRHPPTKLASADAHCG
ncbi:MAG: hypothetical protein R2706_13000 [Acidimicrobiales bacterium]